MFACSCIKIFHDSFCELTDLFRVLCFLPPIWAAVYPLRGLCHISSTWRFISHAAWSAAQFRPQALMTTQQDYQFIYALTDRHRSYVGRSKSVLQRFMYHFYKIRALSLYYRQKIPSPVHLTLRMHPPPCPHLLRKTTALHHRFSTPNRDRQH